MRQPNGIEDAARAAAAATGIVAVVAAMVVASDVHKYAALAICFLVIAAVVTLVVPGPAGPAVGVLFTGIPAFVLGNRLFDLKPTPSTAGALIGEGVPTTARYFAWLACVVMLLAAVVALVASLTKAKPRKASRKVGAVVAVVVLAAGALPVAGALVGVAEDHYGNLDHTTAAGSSPAADAGVPTWQHQRWHRDASPRQTVDNAVAVVPERGLVVQTDIANDRPDMLRVLDARTGVERWHDRITALSAFVDVRDGRLLVVDDPAAVVFDLETGEILGAVRLPALDHSARWQRLVSMPGAARQMPVTGRTVVLGASYSPVEKVLAFDVVTLRMTEIDRNPGNCEYAVPEGGADVIQVIRYHCGHPARLEVTGDRLVATRPLPRSAGDDLGQAVATPDGAVLCFGGGGSSGVNLLLSVVNGRNDPVVEVKPAADETVDAVVLPATARDPRRILVVHTATATRSRKAELMTTSGAQLPTPRYAPNVFSVYLDPVFAAGDRVYLPAPGSSPSMAVLDAHTLALLATVPDPCAVDLRATVGSAGLVQCHDGRVLAYD